jgi:hypothetical protein
MAMLSADSCWLQHARLGGTKERWEKKKAFFSLLSY